MNHFAMVGVLQKLIDGLLWTSATAIGWRVLTARMMKPKTVTQE